MATKPTLSIVTLFRNTKGTIFKSLQSALVNVADVEGFKKESAVTSFHALCLHDSDIGHTTYFRLNMIDDSKEHPIID